MVLNSLEIKKNIIKSILDFKAQEVEIRIEDANEIMALSIEINNLISALDQGGAQFGTKILKPRVFADEYKKLKRVLDLTFKYNTDINSISIDIGENVSYTNKLLQDGIDYIFDNVKIQNFKNHNLNKQTLQKQKEVQTPVAKKGGATNSKKKNTSIGLIAPLMFLALLAGAGTLVYNFFFTAPDTVHTLVQEYKSDGQLSSVARPRANKPLRVQGSKIIVEIIDAFKNKFVLINPSVNLETRSEDSGIAIAKLLDGDISLAASSRMPTVAERKRSQKQRALLVDHKVAMDAVVVFVHPSNPINVLSVEDLRDIFSGDVGIWDYFWYENLNDIEMFAGSPESGTYAFFKERVLFTEEFSSDVKGLYNSDHIVQAVETNPNAIGFASLGRVIGKNVKVVRISTIFDEEGIEPLDKLGAINAQAIKRGEYPLTRYIYLISAGEITDDVAKLVDYIRSTEAQALLGEHGLLGIY